MGAWRQQQTMEARARAVEPLSVAARSTASVTSVGKYYTLQLKMLCLHFL